MKSFDEWFEKQDIDNWTNKKFMLKAFEAGQQSKQSEVDELQKRIDRAVEHIEGYYGVVGLSMIVDTLKGACDE